MADTNETITDIIKKMRAEADYIEETARGSLKAGENYDGIAFTESDLDSALDLAETKRKEADRLDAARKREIDALKQRLAELNAEVAAKDEVIKRLNDAISEEQRRKMATTENPSAVGDCAKLREAVIETQSAIAKCMSILNKIPECGYNVLIDDVADELCGLLKKHIKAALAAPPRNCDMGTAEEQYSRMYRKCYEWMCADCKQCDKDFRKCALSWAQMPYVEKEGGNK